MHEKFERLLTRREVRRRLGNISDTTLYRLLRERAISCYRRRGRAVFAERHVLEYWARVEQKAREEEDAA